MISKKALKDEIITYDIITYTDENGEVVNYVEVTLVDRIIDAGSIRSHLWNSVILIRTRRLTRP